MLAASGHLGAASSPTGLRRATGVLTARSLFSSASPSGT